MGARTVTADEHVRDDRTNGAGMAAFLAAGIGAFVLSILVILNETGTFATPTIYKPAGGISGRTTVATVIWLIVWALLHNRWKEREFASHWVRNVTLVLIVVSLVLTFPPIWHLL